MSENVKATRESTPSASQPVVQHTSATSAGAVKGALRGVDYATGSQMLAPVQRQEPAAKGASSGTAKVVKLAKDLGKAASIREANAMVATYLDGYMPAAGQSVTAELSIKVMIDGLYVGLSFDVSAERTKVGVSLDGHVAVAIGVGVGAGAGKGAAGKAYLGVEGGMGIGSKADSTAECLDLILFAQEQWLRNQEVTFGGAFMSPALIAIKASGGGKWLADMIYGEQFGAEVLRSMDAQGTDEEDTITYTEDLGIEGGVGGELGLGKDTKAEVSLAGNVGYESRTTLGKNKGGRLEAQEERGMAGSISLGGKVGKFEAEGECTFFKGGDASELGLSVEIGIPKGVGTGGELVAAAWGAIAGIIGSKVTAANVGSSLAKAVSEGAINTGRGVVVSGLSSIDLASTKVKFSFSMTGKSRSIKLEIIREIGGDTTVGVGAAAVDVEASVSAGTTVVEKTWDVP